MNKKDKVLAYFGGDDMAASCWKSKYQMKDPSNPDRTVESTPNEMHLRLAERFGFREYQYKYIESANVNKDKGKSLTYLSNFGRELYDRRSVQDRDEIVDEIFGYFAHFNEIVPQGSVMSNLGNPFVFGSLSNCFVVPPPADSYGGILLTDQHLTQLMKRRGGVGTHISTLRPTSATVTNASQSSTGAPSFAERYSNTTREVAQEGRRGALMLLLDVRHPDIFRFVSMKEDRTKVTGANVSVMFTDKFMEAVEADHDFVCRFPVDIPFNIDPSQLKGYEYNNLYIMKASDDVKIYVMKIRAKELFEEFVRMAHSNAEPGCAFIDRVHEYSPDGVYERYKARACNPCGEQWLPAYDTCRLMALNFFGVIKKAFTKDAYIDHHQLYEISYMQQRLGDDLVDLEVEHIDRIIEKILADPEPMVVKQVELLLWENIREQALAGRRTGNGFTGLGDMLAAIGKQYVSPEVVEEVMKTKMRAELDATIDMAILRGTFEGFSAKDEFKFDKDLYTPTGGKNAFYQMLVDIFPDQALKMANFGRRNVSWSTVAPTGTVSVMTQTTSGIEPLFEPFYMRRKKINPNDKDNRVDFVDKMGDKWQMYGVLHPKFKEWVKINFIDVLKNSSTNTDDLTEERLKELFKESPWYGSRADDISWEDRVKINAIVQKYTTNAISCTVNLPKDVPVSTVYNIYFHAWKAGLKGITVYRDGSRDGVLVKEVKQIKVDEFGYLDAPKRPDHLEADYFFVKSNGQEYAIIVGKLNNNPYEIFGFTNPEKRENLKGELVKVQSGEYRFSSPHYGIDNVQMADHPDERLLCRFVSGMLRHGMNPKYIADQVDKSEISVVSFGRAIQRVLKAYIKDEEIVGEPCPNCGETTVVYSEGCKRCTSCGHSKC